MHLKKQNTILKAKVKELHELLIEKSTPARLMCELLKKTSERFKRDDIKFAFETTDYVVANLIAHFKVRAKENLLFYDFNQQVIFTVFDFEDKQYSVIFDGNTFYFIDRYWKPSEPSEQGNTLLKNLAVKAAEEFKE